MRVVILLLAAWLVLGLPTTSRGSEHPSRRQAPDPCPPITCANPRSTPGGQCDTCQGSQCMLRGCVHNGFFTTWRPDPCTLCTCNDGMEACAVVDCAPVQCYGFPVVTRPMRCCQECDFNISSTECGAVPVRTRSVGVLMGETACQQQVLDYECDKQFIVDDEGVWFGCDPVREEVTVSTSDLPESQCGSLVSQVSYETVSRCQKRRLEGFEIPQDYDPDPYSCYYVNGSGPATEPPITDVTSSVPSTTAPVATPLLLACIMVLCAF